MLIESEKSLLLIVDVQEKLIPAMHHGKKVIDHCAWLIDIASTLKIPVVASEQYPKGLGHTTKKIKRRIAADAIFEKTCFSCGADGNIGKHLATVKRNQIVLAGMESHVCVLQSAIDLRRQDYHVFLVADAVCSRDPKNVTLALQRARDNGVEVVSREMVAFEWLQQASTPQFKQVSQRYLK